MCATRCARARRTIVSTPRRRDRWPSDYNRRIDELASRPDLDQAISDDDRIRIGLVALTNRERRIILDHHEQRTVSGAAIEQLLHNTNRILDAARSEGREGYDRAACKLLAFPRRFRIAHFLHRTLQHRRAAAARDFDPLRGAADPPSGARGTGAVRRDPARTDARPRGRRRAARNRRRPRRGDRAGARCAAPAIPRARPHAGSAFSRAIRTAAVDPALPGPVRGGADRRRIVRRSASRSTRGNCCRTACRRSISGCRPSS